jgi:sarcosine oxidase subunit alpha
VIAAALPGSPSFEVAAQAGANVKLDAHSGYAVACDDDGRCAEGVWATGECTGVPFDPEAIVKQAERVAGDVAGALTAHAPMYSDK